MPHRRRNGSTCEATCRSKPLAIDYRERSFAWSARRGASWHKVAADLQECEALGRLPDGVLVDAAAPETLPDVVIALSGLRDRRSLMFALERMEARDASVWAAAVTALGLMALSYSFAVDVRWALRHGAPRPPA